MSLHHDDTISRLQSSTVRSAIALIAVNVLTLVTVFTGITFDLEAVKAGIEIWLPLAINAVSAWLGWRAYKGRVAATSRISPLPWKDEVKTLRKECRMRKLLLTIPLLALPACAALRTPEERYFATSAAVTATARVVERYVDDCKAQPQEDPCHGHLPKINAGAKALQTALTQADKVFVTKDSAYYDLSLSATENALINLRAALKEAPDE